MYSIRQLFIYPVKSLGGIEISTAQLVERGLQYDRRFMLVDANNHFLTQRAYEVMSLLQPVIQNNQLLIHHKNNIADNICVPLQPEAGVATRVKVWETECDALYVSDMADSWFSEKLSIPCRLVYMPEAVKRKVDERYAHKNEITSFADDYPLMMIGQASLDDLNSRLKEPLSMNRFRPNIVFSGGQPYDEDIMKHIIINNIDLYGVKLCARCVITTIDQSTALKGKEPIKTLAGYRMANNKVYFGQNMLTGNTGHLKIGDVIKVVKTGTRDVFNDQQYTRAGLQGDQNKFINKQEGNQ